MNKDEFSNFIDTIKIKSKSKKKQTKLTDLNKKEDIFINKILNQEINNSSDKQKQKDKEDIDINILINDLSQILKKTNNTSKFNYNILNTIEFN